MEKKFREYKQLDLIQVTEEISAFWKENAIFEKSISSREGKESYIFFEGPPSANGLPGIHHAMARTIKDIFCRFQTQKGKQVQRKAGWDTHGLPVELGVEKELGITKEDIGTKISVEEYNEACKRAVMKYTDVWNEMTEKIGYWVDLDDPYITYKPKYMESVWWLLKQMAEKDLLYKGYTIQPYSPKAGTGLSSHELNMPGTYQEVSDTTVVAQFLMDKSSSAKAQQWQEPVYLLAWTTTPWTLPSNTALTVGKKIDYVWVKTYNRYTFELQVVVLAKNLVAKQFKQVYHQVESEDEVTNWDKNEKKIPYCIISEDTGANLVGIKYEQLLPWAQPYENADKAFCVIDGDFVTTEDGTGIVHTAPTFGADDAKVAKEHGVPAMLVLDENQNPIPLVDLQGKFIKSLPDGFGGKYVKNEYYADGDAPEKSMDVEIAILLKTENKAFLVEKYVHPYPHCWRTDKPILYYPLDSWFIKTAALKDRMVELNKTINWKPASTGEGRFGNWLENVNDWNLSRSRYWGIPLPIWRTEDGKETKYIGSVAELYQEIEKSIEKGYMSLNPYAGFEPWNMSDENYETIDLHKNIVDQIILVSESGEPMKREADLIDVWFDSGAMPYAQWHYPFENKEFIDEKEKYPADFIAEGVDQTRGWFYTLHAIGTLVFDSVAYKNVVSNGLVLDKNGQKMSKRLGNAVDPFITIDKYGPDATRWYMIANANPWENLKFSWEKPDTEKGEDFEEHSPGIDEVRKKFFGTLHNTYNFFALYANVDGFTFSDEEVPLSQREEIDRWIISELHTLIKNVEEYYADYEPTKAARAISDFVQDNLSNWYVRLNRRRFWKPSQKEGNQIDAIDKKAAYQTLCTCLLEVSKLMAPIAPFFADNLYQNINRVIQKHSEESVHLTLFPTYQEEYIDEDLLQQAHLAQKITSLVFSLRKQENLKVRQPLQKIMIPVKSKEMKERLEKVIPLIKQEVNVKEVQTLNVEEASHLIEKSIKPNFKVLGPKLGPDMKKVAPLLQKLTNEEINNFEQVGELTIEGYPIMLEDVEIHTKDIPGWVVANEGNITVALDINLTEDLIHEGIARELINRVQNVRKEMDLEVTDSISIQVLSQPEIEKMLKDHQNYIQNETLAKELLLKNEINQGTEIELNDIKTSILITKI